jgi:acetyltransferase-like isoleucine patch superfamily enzyme
MKFLYFTKTLLKSVLRHIGQRFISLLIISQSNIQFPLRIDLPIQVRGKAKNIYLGKNNRLGKNSFLNCKGKLSTKNHVHFHQNTIVYVGTEAQLSIGENFNLGNNTTIKCSQNHWKLEHNISISNNCMIFAREKNTEGIFKMGKNSNISDNTIIDVCDNVIIGQHVAIGNGCTVFTHNHQYSDKTKAAWKGGIS